ncbi:MAG: twin-arginine translocase TatA/TatE family subunit, partial [Candidatus Omnitrophica bacterium]|nr:twin-arginine translocase TatA/TatE family subunit [Candidatus Omnitrophota bacterium]
MFGISNGELIVIFLIILTVVGPKRLPQIARIIGRIAQNRVGGFALRATGYAIPI